MKIRSRRVLGPGLLRCRCALLLGAVLLTATASLQGQTRPFSVHDTNRDGFLNRAEYRQLLELRRSRHLHRQRIPPQPAPAFDEVDRNGDGLIDELELAEALRHKMHRYGRHGPRWRYPGAP